MIKQKCGSWGLHLPAGANAWCSGGPQGQELIAGRGKKLAEHSFLGLGRGVRRIHTQVSWQAERQRVNRVTN
jgi:hypothetical protein